jgi:class 3 adenylate cyclase/predicted ATPase
MASAGKIRCTKCGADNREGAKFCSECATPFAAKCPRCGASNPPGAKFCDECAASLSPASTAIQSANQSAQLVNVAAEQVDASALEGERKTVTALFADIKGSTELEQDLDPEEARAIVDPALKLMIDAVHRYDGYVVQSTGDGIFALFGAPIAHEDHPQRALYAALRMQEELRRYSDKLLADGRAPLEIRVGVNTGEVVVRSISTSGGHVEYTPIGHTTNLASRMQTVAPTGSIAITEDTRRLVEGYFALKARGPTRIKGVSEHVNVYEVIGLGPLRTRLQRSAGRGLTRFVGREHEMEALKHAGELARQGRGQIAAAMAEAGTGKSRLFFEFKAISLSDWMVLETFSVSHGKASAYLPVIELLWNYFRINSADDERTRREKVTGRVVALDRSLEDTLPYLFSLLAIVDGDDPLAQMDGQIKKRRTLEAIKRILLRESLNHPLMVIFEDLHWIDEETQALLNLLADSIGTAKLMLLVNYRPEYTHSWGNKTYYTQLRLDPLGEEGAEDMLTALVGDSAEVRPLKSMIIERTGGNPFFMEETVQVLLDEGGLVRDGATVKLTKELSDLKIPPTVQSILAARIDRLPSDEKDLLQALAAIGKEFQLGLIRAVTAKSDDELNRMLGDLQLAEFIYEQPALGDIEYSFKHALTQEVAYNSVLIERRKLLHERAAVALETMFAAQLDDHLEDLAHHYRRTDNLEKAVEYLGQAGQQAAQRSAYADAIRRLTAAIDLLQKLPDRPQRVQQELLLQLTLGPAVTIVKGRTATEVERIYTRAQQLCEGLGDTPELIPTLFGLWSLYFLRADLQRADELAQQLLRQAQSSQDPAQLLYAHLAVGHTSYGLGEFLRAREHEEIAISIYNPDRHRPYGFQYLYSVCGISWALWQLGYPDQALKRSYEALAIAQTLSDPMSLGLAQTFAGALRQYRGEAREAQRHAETTITLCLENGLPNFFDYATVLSGWVMVSDGHNQEGTEQIQQGLAALHESGAELRKPYFLCLLADACLGANHYDQGLSALQEALAAADKNEDRNQEPEIYRLEGELLLGRDSSNASQAQTCFERAIAVARTRSAKSLELRATTSLARLLSAQGKRDEARVMLGDIYNWFTEGFDTGDLKDAKALLDELGA